MKVEDGLSGSGADIENGAISILDFALAGNICRRQMASADDLGVGTFRFLQSSKMPLGNNQHMRGCLRIDVFEGEDVFILVDFFRVNLAADHTAEEAIGVGRHYWLTFGTQ